MLWETIHKQRRPGEPEPNLADYEAFRRTFTWEEARTALDGLPGGGLNIAYEALDRHLTQGHGDRLALRWLGKDGTVRDFTYVELSAQTGRFASVLQSLGIGRGDRVFSLMGRLPELYIAALGTLKNGSVFAPLLLRLRSRPGAPAHGAGRRRGTGDHPGAVPPQGGGLAGRTAEPEARDPGRRRRGAAGRHGRADDGDGRGRRRDALRRDRARGHGAAALHQRHHRQAQGRDPRARGGGRPPRDGAPRPGPAPRRRFLVHRRPRLGDRHLLRHHLAADQRRDDDRRRGGVRRRAVVRHSPGSEGHGLVHRAHRHPHADEGRRRAGAAARPVEAALHGQRGRAAEPRGRGLEPGGLRPPLPRQLVADRDRRHHDRQLCRRAREARLDGPPPARHRGHGRDPRRAGRGRRRAARGGRRAHDAGRAGAETRLAVDAARLSAQRGTLQEAVRRRLVPDRRPRHARRGRLLLVRRPGGRRHQVGRPPDRSLRGGERPAGARGGGRGRGYRRARRDHGRGGQGLRRAEAGARAHRGAAQGAAGPCPQAPGRRRRPARHRVPRRPAAHAQRQDLTPPAEGARTGPPEGDTSTLESGAS